MNQERRRFTRLNFHQEALLQLGHTKHMVRGIIDLGIGGCKLELPGPFAPDKSCLFIINLHHMAPNLEIKSKIIRSDESTTTLQFMEISQENMVHLQNIVRFNAKDPDKIEEEIQSHPGLV